MTTRSDSPKIFISYSWTTTAHSNWVLELAERLQSDGVAVILDRWDLREGQDKYKFMEQMVDDKTVKKVLIICDKGYTDKANARDGGAGTESQIISSEIYGKVKQEKFIPVIAEVNEDGDPYMPTYLKARIYVDLSDEEKFHDEYEKLLRNIFGRPALKKPPLGSPPSYLFAEEAPKLLTTRTLASFKDAFLHGKPAAKSLLQEYFRLLLETIKLEEINPKPGEFVDDLVISSIERLLPARDEFIDTIDFLVRNDASEEYYLLLHTFFESMLGLTETAEFPQKDSLDNVRFLQYELFVSAISLLLQGGVEKALDILLGEDYFVRNRYSRDVVAFHAFRRFTDTLNTQRKQRLKLNRKSVQADLLVERANHPLIPKERLIEADFVLLVRSLIVPRESLRYWYPQTIIYTSDSIVPFEIFFRAQSVRNFEFIKKLFKVKSIEELIEKLKQSAHEQILRDYYVSSFHTLDELMGIQKLYDTHKSTSD